MPLPVGIDLGTTNSVISVYRRGRPEALRVDGEYAVPSVVCFRDEETTLVGVKALGMAMIRPESTILSVKRKMGDRHASYDVHGARYSPVDISAMILKKLCAGHEEELDGPPCDAVITVPAYFTEDQRRDTKLAGEKAGLNVLRLLPEPTAAAIAIGLDKGRDQTILVYDLGGGTFDVSILKVQNNNFTVLAVNGNHDLGGNDFDAALRDYALDVFQKNTGTNLRTESAANPEVRKAMQILASACEQIKMELSDAEEAFLSLPNFFQGAHLETEVTRRTFEGLIRPLIDDTRELVLKTISDACGNDGQPMEVDDIDRLVLVGGSTKIPLVAQVLAETVKEPFAADNVDLAVSAGAAIMAANLHAVREGGTVDFAPVEVTDVVSHPISVEFQRSGQPFCEVLIPRNSPLPSSGKSLAMAYDPRLGMATAPAYRGGERLPKQNVYLGELLVKFQPTHREVWLEFTLTLDADGVLVVESAIVDVQGTNVRSLLQFNPKELHDRIVPKPLKVTSKASAVIQVPA